MSIYQHYLEHQKQASGMDVLSGLAGGANLPLSAGGLIKDLGSGIKSLGGHLTNWGAAAARPTGLRATAGAAASKYGEKFHQGGEKLETMTRNLMNKGPSLGSYDTQKLPGGPAGMFFDKHTQNGGRNEITAQRALNWAGNAAAAGGMVHGVASALAPAPSNAVKTAHADFASLVAYMENNT